MASFHTSYWYEQDEKDLHSALYPYLAYLKVENQGHVNELLRNHRLYANQPVTAFGPYAFYRTIANVMQSFDASTLNVIASCCDTLQSRISGTTRPAVEFVTKSGDWLQRRKAKELNKFIDGIFYQNKIYEMNRQQVLDAAIYGNAWKHWYKENGKVKCERVFPVEMSVDPSEAMLGNPRAIYRTKYLNRDKLMHLAKRLGFKNLKLIEDVKAMRTGNQQVGSKYVHDIIEVHEAWRLPSYEVEDGEKTDGVHAIIIENATLLKEEYSRDYFPFTQYIYKKKPMGAWGESVASQLVRNQVMINRLLKIIDKSLVSLANPKIWATPGSQFNPDKFTRDIGGVIMSTVKPEILTQQIIPPEVYTHLDYILQKSYEIIGIGQQAASGVKQPGITAAVAVEAVDNIQDDRLSDPSLAYEELFVDDAKLAIALMKEISDEDGDYEVSLPGRSGLEVAHWKEVSEDLDDDAYVLQANSVSSLPKQVPGKLQYLTDLQAMGVLAPFQIPRLIANPDVDSVIDPMMAVQDRIYQIIDNILDYGEEGFEGPDALIDPQQQLTLVLQAYAKAQYDGAPDDRLALLSQYIVQLKQILSPAPAPQPPMQAGPLPPQAMPPPGGQPPPPGAGPTGPPQAPIAPNPATLQLG